MGLACPGFFLSRVIPVGQSPSETRCNQLRALASTKEMSWYTRKYVFLSDTLILTFSFDALMLDLSLGVLY